MNSPQFLTSIQSNQLLETIGLENLPDQDKAATISSLLDHFNTLILDTAIVHMNESQLQQFEKALKFPSPQREEVISDITSQIPGLTKILDAAIEQELKVVRSAYTTIK